MVRILLFIGSFAIVAFIGIVLFGWRAITRFLAERKARQIEMLAVHHKRLHSVVDNLLAKADQIDQEQKYLPQPITLEASKRLGKTCNELVTLTDTLKLIGTQLKAKNVRKARQILLSGCRIAAHANRELDRVRDHIHERASESRDDRV
jgi:uncharacterized membrane protein YcjF (UPF0283 family)